MTNEVKHTWDQIGSAREFFRLRNVVGRLAVFDKIEPKWSQEIGKLYSGVGTWHGTGRYQYRNGEITDVLDSIIKVGHIATHYDTFDMTRQMESASVAISRMYARTYADLYRHNPKEIDRHGTSLFWGSIFLTDIMMEAVLESRMWTPEGYEKIKKHFGSSQLLRWCERMTTDTGSNVMGIYRKGSDIPDNHPIVFGIADGSFIPTPTSRTISVHEIRTEEPLTLEDHITHVEVPAAYIEKVGSSLVAAGHDLPVIAIEEAERHVANFPFSALLLGRTATPPTAMLV